MRNYPCRFLCFHLAVVSRVLLWLGSHVVLSLLGRASPFVAPGSARRRWVTCRVGHFGGQLNCPSGGTFPAGPVALVFPQVCHKQSGGTRVRSGRGFCF